MMKDNYVVEAIGPPAGLGHVGRSIAWEHVDTCGRFEGSFVVCDLRR